MDFSAVRTPSEMRGEPDEKRETYGLPPRSSVLAPPRAKPPQSEPMQIGASEDAPLPVVVERRKRISIDRRRIIGGGLRIASIGALFLFWYVGTRWRLQFYIRFQNVPTPWDVLQQVSTLGQSDDFILDIGMSLRRILSGFAFAIALGVPLGLVIGRYRAMSELFMPAVEVLRPIPAIAWVPMAIMLWPTSESSIVFITFIGAFFPILLNTIDGVRSLDGVLVRAGRCLGAGEIQILWNVILPGSLSHIFTGLAVGMGVAWVSLIAAEMISGQYGVGYYTWQAYSLVNYPEIVLGMITIGVLGLSCSGLIRLAGAMLMPWRAFRPGSKQ
jgi:NitT/TauT family transport system permease protein